MSISPLIKVLSESGAGSRRSLADAIKHGKVKVNGKVAEDFRHPVNKKTDNISIDGQTINIKAERLVYIMLNKPSGIISTTNDELGRGSITDVLPQKYRDLRLYPVGRLDKNSTGLLILTNNGDITYRLTHPKFEHEKEYLVSIKSNLRPQDKRKIEKGIALEDGVTHPAKIHKVGKPPYNYSIIIHEGRKRQVRRMFTELGHQVQALKRIRTGNLVLGNLPEGHIRELTNQELQSLISDKA